MNKKNLLNRKNLSGSNIQELHLGFFYAKSLEGMLKINFLIYLSKL